MNEQDFILNRAYKICQDLDRKQEEWSDLDEQMYLLGWLNDSQIVLEADMAIERNSSKDICQYNDEADDVVAILESAAVSAVEIWREYKSLHANDRYVLEYYLSLCHLKII